MGIWWVYHIVQAIFKAIFTPQPWLQPTNGDPTPWLPWQSLAPSRHRAVMVRQVGSQSSLLPVLHPEPVRFSSIFQEKWMNSIEFHYNSSNFLEEWSCDNSADSSPFWDDQCCQHLDIPLGAWCPLLQKFHRAVSGAIQQETNLQKWTVNYPSTSLCGGLPMGLPLYIQFSGFCKPKSIAFWCTVVNKINKTLSPIAPPKVSFSSCEKLGRWQEHT